MNMFLNHSRMNYFPRFAKLPDDVPLLQQIDAAAERLAARIQALDISSLDISEYNQRYFGSIVKNLRGTLTLNSYLLALAFADSTKPFSESVFVDYGGGSGTLSFLAVELGVGTVLYNDIYDVSCNDAKKIGIALGSSASAYVNGDMDALVDYVRSNQIRVDTMVSYDVIEHIYDLDSFFSKIPLLSDGSMRVVSASSANRHNPVINYKRMKVQKEIEHNDRRKMWGHKERDALQSYLGIRRNIISTHAPNLGQDEIEVLAHKTRGLIKSDIESIVDTYCATRVITYATNHPSNTCDPLTGNWAEHLMDTADVQKMHEKSGFEVSILPGYFDSAGKSYKRAIREIFNMLISMLGLYCLVVAPFYIVYGNQASNRKSAG